MRQTRWAGLLAASGRHLLAGALFLVAGGVGVAAQEKPASGATTNPPAAVAPAPLADPRAASDQMPGGAATSVTVGNGFLNQRLPFDIPFYITGAVSNPVATRVDLLVYRLRRSAGTSQFVSELQRTYTCETDAGPVFARSRSSVSSSRTFTLLVDPLDPQRYYVFCFIAAGPVPLTEIEEPVRKILADTFRPHSKSVGDVSVALGRDIHNRLRQEIERIGARRSVPAVIPEGNLFHANEVIEPGERFPLLLGRMMEAYRNAEPTATLATQYQETLKSLQGDVAEAQKTASEFLTSDVLATLPLNVRLPDADLAITSSTPLALGNPPFMLAAAKTALRNAADRARRDKKDTEAKVIESLASRVQFLEDDAGTYALAFEALAAAARDAIGHVLLEAREVNVNLGSTVLGADLSRNAYVSLDAGIAYPWRLENMVFYAGTNIYFRPINKDAPLRDKGTFLHRFALTIGVTTTVKDDSRRAIDLRPTENKTDTSNSLLIGGGIRVTSSIRLGVGALVFKESHTNPLIEQTSVRATPYVALAADINVAEALKSFFP